MRSELEATDDTEMPRRVKRVKERNVFFFFDTFSRSPDLQCLAEDAAIDAIWPDIEQAERPCI